MSTSALARNLGALKTLRGLTRELRFIYKTGPLNEHRLYNFLLEQFRHNEVTSQQICRGEREALHAARAYLCYLQSVRKYQELVDKYKGQGEKSVEQAAQMVGLNLPKTDPR